MENSLVMGFGQSLRSLINDRGDAAGGKWCFVANDVGQRAPIQQFHGEIEQTFLSDAEIIKGDDVRIAQRADCLGFDEEALDRSFVLDQLATQNFQGHDAVDDLLLGAIDNPHAAFAQSSQHLVPVVEHCAGEVPVKRCNQADVTVRAHFRPLIELVETSRAETVLHDWSLCREPIPHKRTDYRTCAAHVQFH